MSGFSIVHIIPRLGFGGAERLVIDIVKELSKYSNITCTLVALHPSQKDFNTVENTKGISYLELDYYKIKNKEKRVDFLFDELQKINPNIIHTHLFEAELLVRKKLIEGVKYYTHCHDNMWQLNIKTATFKFSFKQKLLALYESKKLISSYKKCANFFIYISDDTEDFYQKNLPKKLSDKGCVIHNAIDYKKFYNACQKQLKSSIVKFVNVGSLVNKKNQQFLIDVMIELKKRNVEFELNLLGDGPNRGLINEKIKINNLENNVHLLGNVTNVESYLFKSDIYLHSATYEPFGLVLLEAMAAGLPTVCYNGKGNADIIEDDKNGYILTTPTPQEFADKIMLLLNDKTKYEAISEYAKLYAEKFDITHYAVKLLELYNSNHLI